MNQDPHLAWCIMGENKMFKKKSKTTAKKLDIDVEIKKKEDRKKKWVMGICCSYEGDCAWSLPWKCRVFIQTRNAYIESYQRHSLAH
jgi:hypothetical protein